MVVLFWNKTTLVVTSNLEMVCCAERTYAGTVNAIDCATVAYPLFDKVRIADPKAGTLSKENSPLAVVVTVMFEGVDWILLLVVAGSVMLMETSERAKPLTPSTAIPVMVHSKLRVAIAGPLHVVNKSKAEKKARKNQAMCLLMTSSLNLSGYHTIDKK
jgi:hypothetical protein